MSIQRAKRTRNRHYLIVALALISLFSLAIFYQRRQAITANNVEPQLGYASTVTEPPARSLEKTDATPRRGAQAYAIDTKMDVPQGSAMEVVEHLRVAAESGDDEAAFAIYLKLHSCRDAFKSNISSEVIEAYKKAGAAEALLSGIEEDLKECAGAKELLAQRGKWLEQAADAGLVEAQLLYAIDSEAIVGTGSDLIKDPQAVERYKKKAMTYLHSAASNGNVDALIRLGSGYNNGVLTKRDPIRAYAYYRAAQLAKPNMYSESVVSTYRANVPAEMKVYADQMARVIYRNCCGGH